MNSKTNELFNSVASCNWSIIAFTETWLNSSVHNSELFTADYNVFRADRDYANTNYNRGGGVLLAVDINLCASLVDLSQSNLQLISTIDILGVKLTLHCRTIYIFVIYVPPGTKADDYENLFEIISSINILHNNDILIVGDFNIPSYYSSIINDQTNTQVAALNNFMNFLNLSQYNFSCNSNTRILDLVLSSYQCTVNKCDDILLKEDIHHPALIVSFKIQSVRAKENFPTNFKSTFNFRKANFPFLYEQLYSTNWTFLNEYSDIDEACSSFYRHLSQIFETCVPKSKAVSKRKFPPWFTASIKKDIRLKEKLWHAYNRNREVDTLNEFKRLRTKIKLDIKNAQKSFIDKAENSINYNPNFFWSYINSKKKHY